MKRLAFFLIFVISTISVFAQDISKAQTIEAIYELYQKEQFQVALKGCDNFLTTLDTLQGRKNYEAIISLKGNILRQIGKPLLAIPLHQKAREVRQEIYGPKSLKVSRSLFNIGNCYIDKELYPLALDFLLKAKSIKETQVLSESGLINVYNSLATCYENLNQEATAKQYALKAIDIATNIYGQNTPQLIFPLNTLANLYVESNHPDSAFLPLKRAIKIQQDSIGIYHSTTALLYNNLAKSFGGSGQYTQAIDWLQEGLSLYQKIEAPNPKIQADIFLNLGNYYLDKGINKLGLTYLERAHNTYTNFSDKTATRNSIGLAYRYLGETDKAIEQLSIPISQVGDTIIRGKFAVNMANIYINSGSCFFDKKEYEAAKYFLEKGKKLYEQENTTQSVPSNVYNKLGQCFLGLHTYDLANQYFKTALEKAVGSQQFGSLYFLGEVQNAQKNHQSALTYFENALDVLGNNKTAKQTAFPFESIQIHAKLTSWWLDKARKSNKITDWEQASLYAHKAISILEELKGTVKEHRSEINLQNTFYQIYNYAIEIALALNQPEQAFLFAEKYKSNVLKKVAKYTAEAHGFNLPKTLLAEEAQLKEALTFYEKQRFTLENQFLSESEHKLQQAVTDSIGVLVDKKSRWQKYIKENYPAYYQLMEQDSILKVADIQASLANNQTIIEFQWTERKLLSFLLTKDTLLVFQLNNSDSLKAAIYEFNKLSKTQPELIGDQHVVDIENFVRLASSLYNELIQPIKPYIKEELIIIPDSWLYFLPFECLIKEQGKESHHFRSHQYLVQEVAISYDFAATLAIKKDKNSKGFQENLLIIAPSFVNNSRNLKALKYSEDEVREVASVIKATVWTDENALEKQFVQEAHKYQILHISSHGIMNNQHPDYSFVAFTEQPDSIENEVLYVSEIYNMPINADLVVLSACQTADGKLYRGEGLLSIAHAFMYAGAKSIVASLWNVDDEQTPVLMKRFYEALEEGLTKSKAMQKAKINHLKYASSFKAHPYYWAGFMVIGNTQALDIVEGNSILYLGIFLGSSLAILGFFWWKKFNSMHKPV